MTMAWMRLVDAAMRSSSSGPGAADTFDAFSARHPFLLEKDALKRFYSADVLLSDRARQEWVEPDLARLPGAP
jgi:hypothetical protein